MIAPVNPHQHALVLQRIIRLHPLYRAALASKKDGPAAPLLPSLAPQYGIVKK
ncbi:MAG: hypothetical protein HXY51_01785 [Nitrospirae bacterium]|nr:hypothetical protein [Nitrospirota bacterium]